MALYQIRVLLSSYLGSQNEGDMSVRQAAHLAYALHNEALALVEGGSFDPTTVIRRLEAVDAMLSSEFTPATELTEHGHPAASSTREASDGGWNA